MQRLGEIAMESNMPPSLATPTRGLVVLRRAVATTHAARIRAPLARVCCHESSTRGSATLQVTAILPYYNSSSTIERALASIAGQSSPPAEIIVIDDASPGDGESAALDDIAAKWPATAPPLRIVHRDVNNGPATARNYGWELARTEWIAFCDADDVWHPDKLALQGRVADGADLLLAPRVSGPASLPGRVDRPIGSRRLTRWQLLAWNRVVTSSVVLRRDLPVRFTEGRSHSEDYELWLRIVLAGRVAREVPFPLVATQIEVADGQGLSSNLPAMIAGEYETYRLVRRDGLLGPVGHALARAGCALRTAVRPLIRRVLHRRSGAA